MIWEGYLSTNDKVTTPTLDPNPSQNRNDEYPHCNDLNHGETSTRISCVTDIALRTKNTGALNSLNSPVATIYVECCVAVVRNPDLELIDLRIWDAPRVPGVLVAKIRQTVRIRPAVHCYPVADTCAITRRH